MTTSPGQTCNFPHSVVIHSPTLQTERKKEFQTTCQNIWRWIRKDGCHLSCLHLLPFWGTIRKSPSALQKAEFSIDLLAVYLHFQQGTRYHSIWYNILPAWKQITTEFEVNAYIQSIANLSPNYNLTRIKHKQESNNYIQNSIRRT